MAIAPRIGIRIPLNFQGISAERVTYWVPTLARWGVAGGLAVVLFGQNVPLFRRKVMANLPVVGPHWKRPGDDELNAKEAAKASKSA
ncbi:hypothetical protein GQ42DRAFT_79287 [Ramicandelaber brevisporus]|nr:hypothetical protein GQ42DRAFT_79287 [Ramicandelaber brevisporus]